LMAYSLRLTSLGILAQILMGMGYWQAYTSGLWSSDRVDIDPNWTDFAFQHMPLVATSLFLPLAYWCRSQAIFMLTGIAFISSFQSSFQPVGMWGGQMTATLNFVLSCCVPPLLLWGYGNLSQWWQGNRRDKTGAFARISRRLGALSLGSTCFTLSFVAFWAMFSYQNPTTLSQVPVIWDGAIVAIVTIGIWLYLIWQARTNSRQYPWDWTTTAVGGVSCLMAVTIVAQLNTIDRNIYAPIIFCLLLFGVAIGLIRSGLANSDRGAFWFGLGLLSSRIIIGFLMIQSDLMTKSLLFIICGIGVIAIGLWFERHVRRLSESKVN
jgi:uncharacterized membrane protein